MQSIFSHTIIYCYKTIIATPPTVHCFYPHPPPTTQLPPTPRIGSVSVRYVEFLECCVQIEIVCGSFATRLRRVYRFRRSLLIVEFVSYIYYNNYIIFRNCTVVNYINIVVKEKLK